MPVSLSPASTLSEIDIAGNGFGFWNTMPMLAPRLGQPLRSGA